MNKKFVLFKVADEAADIAGTVGDTSNMALSYGAKLAPSKLRSAAKAIQTIYNGLSAADSASLYAQKGNPADWLDAASIAAGTGVAGPVAKAASVGWTIGRIAGELGLDEVINNFASTIQDDSDLIEAEIIGELLNLALKAKDKAAGLAFLQSAQSAITEHMPVVAAKPPSEKRNAALKSLRDMQTFVGKINKIVSGLPERKRAAPL
jgi:hypothetical protein